MQQLGSRQNNFLPLFVFSLPFSLSPPHTHRCLMSLSCWAIGLSISLSVSLSDFPSPPSIKLLLVLSLSVSAMHSVPFLKLQPVNL